MMNNFKPIVNDFLNGCVLTIAFLIMALVLNGDWLVIMVHVMKHLNMISIKNDHLRESSSILEHFGLKDFSKFWFSSMIFGFSIYFIFGGFYHWYYYVKQSDHPENWKCQPTRWLTSDLELDAIKNGCLSLFVTNTWSALMACFIYNGGYSTVYYQFDKYGWFWWFLQWVVIFVYQDYFTYWIHRIFHLPFLYTRFHKLHHRYKQPTAFTATAIHPVEMTCIQMIMVMPLFTVPVHWLVFYVITLYTYYHGLVTHSGINFKHKWWQPWQPDAIFHDNHHQYFHVNFGFNCFLWDKIHGTYRLPDRIYNENIFFGKGKHISEANEDELKNEIEERLAESGAAYDRIKNLCLMKNTGGFKNN